MRITSMRQAKFMFAVTLSVLAASPALTVRAEEAVPAVTLAQSTAATALVKDFYVQLTEAMKQGDELGFAGRYKKLQPAVEQSFNMPLMTRVAVGSSWNEAQADEQKELVTAFTSFSVANYASQFTKYNGEQFAVLGEKPAAGGGTIVETTLTPKGKDPVALNYLVRPDDSGKLRIVDVLLDATISQLATRRAEFSAVVKRDGFSALATMLSEKSKKMGPS